jgi:hypothetical protein
MRADIRGPFRVWDDSNADRTPPGIKARALLALLLLSPKQRRTRAWLQDKLWSDSSPELASVSFRQALSQTRKALGPLSARMHSDRSAVWLDPLVPLNDEVEGTNAEILDDLDPRDPEFVNWLRDVRQQYAGENAGPPTVRATDIRAATTLPADNCPHVSIVCIKPGQTTKGQFLAHSLAGRIASDLIHSGQVIVTLNEKSDRAEETRKPGHVTVEIETLGEEESWYVAIRTITYPANRCVWTGRLQLPMSLSYIWNSTETVRFINKAVSTIVDALALSARPTPFTSLQRGIRRIYEFDRAGLESADVLLRAAQDGDEAGVALAWRGFLRLTSAFEFRDESQVLRDEAVAFSNEAMARGHDNPVVLGLTARVQMELVGDFDYGKHLAHRAVEAGDLNAYALDAMSQAHIFQGSFEEGYKMAERAMQASAGMPNSFSWDMLCCHAALGLGLQDEALAHALACHRKMPSYRPALRYLVALHLMAGHPAEASHYEARLRLLEPDFSRHVLLKKTYPIETLRNLGLIERLQSQLG